MILSCPNCAARFLVESWAIGRAGRTVRCGRCGHEWHAVAAPAEEAPPPPAQPVTPMPLPPGSNLPAIREDGRGGWVHAVGWVGLLLVLVLAAAAMVARDQVVELWPDSARAYAAIGMQPPRPGEGLRFSDVTITRNDADGAQSLIVEGLIRNESAGPRVVPPLRGALRDAARRDIQAWVFAAPRERLAAGESVRFRTEVRDPSPDAADIDIAFTAGN